MKQEFLKYSIEELLEDKQFVAWVLTSRKDYEWEKIINDNPGINSKISKAREIVLLLRDTYEEMDEASVLNMWQNIDQLDHQHKHKVRVIKIRKSLSWAVSILLIISVGTFGYYKFGVQDSSYQFTSTEIPSQNSEARIVLSDGEEIVLNSDNSTIALNNDNKLVIDNDNIIDLSNKKVEKNNEVQMNEVVIPFGKQSELLLADGTKVWLNAGSRLAFPTKFTNKNREVFLEGEACFEVAKNEQQPFIVNAAEIEVEVLGTHFNISAYSGDANIETVLLEGSVVLTTTNSLGLGKNEIILKPNQKASLQKKRKSFVVTDEADAYMYIAWTKGWLEFSRESLQSVFSKMERYYNIEISTPQNFPSSEIITGKLDLKDSLEDVMKVLSDVAKLEYRIVNNTIEIDKKMNKIHMK